MFWASCMAGVQYPRRCKPDSNPACSIWSILSPNVKWDHCSIRKAQQWIFRDRCSWASDLWERLAQTLANTGHANRYLYQYATLCFTIGVVPSQSCSIWMLQPMGRIGNAMLICRWFSERKNLTKYCNWNQAVTLNSLRPPSWFKRACPKIIFWVLIWRSARRKQWAHRMFGAGCPWRGSTVLKRSCWNRVVR